MKWLLALFFIRVVAQLVQWLAPAPFLPPFAAWHSGRLPYEALLAGQLILLVIMGAVTLGLARGRLRARPVIGTWLLTLGAVYFATMLYRLFAAILLPQEGVFLASKPLPACFHVVLSLWVTSLGLYHLRGDAASAANARLAHWLVYPTLIASSLLLHRLLLSFGWGLQLSAYVPVGIGALAITLLERWIPHREEWHPHHHEVVNDLTFMLFVQILLPKILAFAVAVTALRWLGDHGIALRDWWPHEWPIVAQAALMLLAADFLRYWLHRASHEWSPWLWRFHAVHHSPPKLYWVNVGRFHPLEKALQFLCDAAPFILL
ncbi:MAG TPA: sterol desaturase family protein, partial [Candidatus Synoicihabitans sp.]|nr:sterol desaturase family protein [Candidatus Synoicihabitans sp.]